MPDALELAITAVDGVFPGAADANAFWDNVVAGRVAPLRSLSDAWGLPRSRYFAHAPGATDRTYLDVGFAVATGADASEDRQIGTGRRVIERVLEPHRLDARRVALVAATSWTAPDYFAEDAARVLASSPPGGRGHAPEEQLRALARDELVCGPRLAVDTACASSLYGLELARGLLSMGAADAVVVVGLSVMLPPFLYLGFARLGALSASGRTLPFSSDADGFVPGECAAAVLVEPAGRAVAAGRTPLAIIRGIGLSSDGADRSIFAPGIAGQRLAYVRAHASLDPADVDYVEAHGTATTVGDETELGTLDGFFSPARRRGAALPIGSVKALVGHTLAAAGMASLTKAILMLRHATVPPHFTEHPHPRLSETRLTLAQRPERTHLRRIAVSSFGFGGANAHVVLDAPDRHARAKVISAAPPPPTGLDAPDDPVAIVDLALQVGSWSSAEALTGALRDGQLPGPLPARLTVEAEGLRMGPNLLRRVDPLQLLTTHLVRELLERHPFARGSAGTSIVMVSNLGGAVALQLSRKYTYLLGREERAVDPATALSLGPELTPETIASSLPTMCSGYPAFHHDLRGFHATLSGGSDVFPLALRLADGWLGSACDQLVLGAARMIKSPIEADRDVPGEGALVFLLMRTSRARSLGQRILATLAPHDDPQASGAGVLAEASGALALARALLLRERSSRGPRLHLEPLTSVGAAEAPTAPRLPLVIDFHPARSVATDARTSPAAAYLTSSAAGVRAFLASQRHALRLLGGAATTLPGALRRTQNAVITAASLGAAGLVRAELIVREDHPYFFDHPLDHVPGVLLLAAIEDLALASGDGRYLSSLELRFRRFVEKDQPAFIELGASGAGRVMQGEDVAATFSLAVERAARGVPSAATRRDPYALAQAALVHKRNAENVMVGPLEQRPEGSFTCGLAPPPSGHFLDEGDADHHRAIYLLEAMRQAVTLAAHVALEIPVGAQMSLTALGLRFSAVVPRADLVFHCRPERVRTVDGMTLAEVTTTLWCPTGELGQTRLRAHVVDEATYAAMRKRTP